MSINSLPFKQQLFAARVGSVQNTSPLKDQFHNLHYIYFHLLSRVSIHFLNHELSIFLNGVMKYN